MLFDTVMLLFFVLYIMLLALCIGKNYVTSDEVTAMMKSFLSIHNPTPSYTSLTNFHIQLEKAGLSELFQSVKHPTFWVVL